MKHVHTKAALLALTLGTTLALTGTPASAQMAGGADQGMSGAQGMAAGSMGQHEMGGKVTMINHRTGLMHIKTAEGMMVIHFPPKSLAKVKKGEKLNLHLSFTPEQ